MFILTIKYMDGEELEVSVRPEDMEGFVESFGQNQVYFNSSRGLGLWIPVDKVRHLKIERVDDKGDRVIEDLQDVSILPDNVLLNDCLDRSHENNHTE